MHDRNKHAEEKRSAPVSGKPPGQPYKHRLAAMCTKICGSMVCNTNYLKTLLVYLTHADNPSVMKDVM